MSSRGIMPPHVVGLGARHPALTVGVVERAPHAAGEDLPCQRAPEWSGFAPYHHAEPLDSGPPVTESLIPLLLWFPLALP